MIDPTSTAVGTWSGGRFMHFGEPLPDDRLEALLRPDEAIATVLSADVYGEGEADRALGRALEGVPREQVCVVGAIGHDFYEGTREGPRGYPRFTDPRLRGPDAYGAYLRMATQRSLERLGLDRFDLLLLHNPDRIGFGSPQVWEGMVALREAGLTRLLGVAPGPANGFTLDLIDCMERFGASIDWAMIILNPLEPWPGELVLDAAQACDVKLITRVVDYGGLFHDDVLPGHQFAAGDHRGFRPRGLGGRRAARGSSACARSHSAHSSPCCNSPASGTSPTRRSTASCRRSSRRPAPARARSRTSAPSSPRCRRSCDWTPTTSRRSGRSATTPAAWR